MVLCLYSTRVPVMDLLTVWCVLSPYLVTAGIGSRSSRDPEKDWAVDVSIFFQNVHKSHMTLKKNPSKNNQLVARLTVNECKRYAFTVSVELHTVADLKLHVSGIPF